MHEIAASLGVQGHEHVQVVHDRTAGLLCIVAIHSTASVPAIGGVRRAGYPTLGAALDDVLRRSHAMTRKINMAGLPLGGGASVIVDASKAAPYPMLDSFADVVDLLGGLYVASQDLGTTPGDMDRIGRGTSWVVGTAEANGGAGNPSPATARTVLGAIEHALRIAHGSPDLAARRVGVLGAGAVGGELVARLAQRGAEVLVADSDRERTFRVADLPGVRVVDGEQLLTEPLDVLAPCAHGGTITRETVRTLRARIVCGAADDALAEEALAHDLHAAGVLHVPGFVANAGGIIRSGGTLLRWSDERIDHELNAAIARTGELLDEAHARSADPLDVALANETRMNETRVSETRVSETRDMPFAAR